ncbi:MAG: hypothetical protein WC916_00005 [Candidatus Woesearchaeota archaeon]
MELHSLEDLALIRQIGAQSMSVNNPQYLEDFASGVLDSVKKKYVAYLEGHIIRDEQKRIISGDTSSELLVRLPKTEQLYYIIHVGTIDYVRGERFKFRN